MFLSLQSSGNWWWEGHRSNSMFVRNHWCAKSNMFESRHPIGSNNQAIRSHFTRCGALFQYVVLDIRTGHARHQYFEQCNETPYNGTFLGWTDAANDWTAQSDIHLHFTTSAVAGAEESCNRNDESVDCAILGSWWKQSSIWCMSQSIRIHFKRLCERWLRLDRNRWIFDAELPIRCEGMCGKREKWKPIQNHRWKWRTFGCWWEWRDLRQNGY